MPKVGPSHPGLRYYNMNIYVRGTKFRRVKFPSNGIFSFRLSSLMEKLFSEQYIKKFISSPIMFCYIELPKFIIWKKKKTSAIKTLWNETPFCKAS